MDKTTRMNMPAMLRLMELADYAVPFALQVLLGAGVIERLAGGPRPAAELAVETETHPGALERLLRALACKGLVSEEPAGTFALTDLGAYLRSDHPHSVRARITTSSEAIARWASAADDVRGADWPFAHAAAAAATARRELGDPGGARRVLELADCALPATIRAVSELRLPDLLAEQPASAPELARASGVPVPSLQAAMSALHAAGLVDEVRPGVFATTETGDLMRADRPHSLWGCLPLAPADLRAWSALDYTLRSGEPAFAHVHGQTYYEYLAERPSVSARFDAAQEGATRLELRAALRGYDWSVLGTLVDVGGGNGTFLSGLLKRHPGLTGVLFDLPFVVPLSQKVLAEHGVADRCEVHGGSFFDGVPAGHDAYLLKRTLYNWDCVSAVRILRAIRDAMRTDSKLLIFEPTRRPGDTFDVATLTDVIMLVFTGGALRTPDEIGALLAEARLRLARAVPTPMFPVLEIEPV